MRYFFICLLTNSDICDIISMRDKKEVRTIINISERNKLEHHLDLWITGGAFVCDDSEDDEYEVFDGCDAFAEILRKKVKEEGNYYGA